MIRRVAFVLSLLVLIGVVIFYWPGSSGGSAGGNATTQSKAKASGQASGTTSGASSSGAPANATSAAGGVGAANPETDFPIAAALNAPGSTVMRDLDIVRQIFEAWQSNYPREGNPVGENAEITAALMGENRLGLALIPKGHRALNERGELCDRWGTPFRFHQISGTRMEIRSAGPDRRFATEDDAVWTPQ
jgi:hypothetical protein